MDNMSNWSNVIEVFGEDHSVIALSVECTTEAFPIDIMIGGFVPDVFLAQVLAIVWFSAGKPELTFEFVGDGSLLQIKLTAAGGVDVSLGVVVIPVPGDVATCQFIRINIELLSEREFVILIGFFSVTFDVNKGHGGGLVAIMNSPPNFSDDIPV